ncbi:hypothetical protein ACHAWO_004219 [Cyclotella atomus]|uniref:Uncharacterized protein n=1 Tax=Cyclotella atomus TaxID=382360 RepID=A0ABD3QYA6_9STRA
MTIATPSPTTVTNSSSTSTAGLIVDFPAQRTINQSSSKTKSVTFSSISELRVFRRPTDSENKMKSYCKRDYERFNLERNIDTLECSMMLATKRGELSPDDTCMCVGLESFLAPDVHKRMKKVKRSREKHVRVVVEEQKRQRQSNSFDHEAISLVSRRSSFNARVQSYKLAVAAASVHE